MSEIKPVKLCSYFRLKFVQRLGFKTKILCESSIGQMNRNMLDVSIPYETAIEPLPDYLTLIVDRSLTSLNGVIM